MKTTEVIAVVVTFNRCDLLIECINSLLKQTPLVKSIIVVNNASTDGTSTTLSGKYKDEPRIIVLEQTENLGGAGGFEVGVRYASRLEADYIWIMDDDAEPQHNCLQRLISALSRNPDIVATAPKVIGLDNNIQTLHRGVLKKLIIPNIQRAIPSSAYNKESEMDIDTASFVGLLIKRNVTSQIGYPLGDMFIYNDDIEYCLRLRNIGRIRLVSNAVILHKDTPRVILRNVFGIFKIQIIPIERYRLIYLNRRNYIYMSTKHLKHAPWVKLQLFLGLIYEIIKIIVFMDRKSSRILAQWYSYRDGKKGQLGKVPDYVLNQLKD